MSDDPWDMSNYKTVLDKIKVERDNPKRTMNGGNPRARGRGRGGPSLRARGPSSPNGSAGRGGGGPSTRGSSPRPSSAASSSSYREDDDSDRRGQSSASSSTSRHTYSTAQSGYRSSLAWGSSSSPVGDILPDPPMHRPPPVYMAPPHIKPPKVHTPFNVERERPYQHIPKPPALLNKNYFRTPPPRPVRANALPTQEDAFRAYQKEQEISSGQKQQYTPRPDKLRLVPLHVVVGTRRGKTIYSDFQHPTPSVSGVGEGEAHHPFISVNLSRTHFYFELFLEAHRDCEAMWPLAGEILFEDVVAGGVQLEDGELDGNEVQILTITSRRPPKYTVHLKEPVSLLDASASGSGMSELYGKRQATEMDFAVGETVTETQRVMIDNGAIVDKRVPVVKRKEELDAGPVSSFGRTTSNGLRFEAAHWTTFRFTFPKSSRRALFEVMNKLAQLTDDDISHTIVARMAHDAISQPLAEPNLALPSPNLGGLNKQPFEIRYLVDTLVANGRIRTWDVAKLLTALDDHTKQITGLAERMHIQARILEDLFWEEKILNIHKQVSKLAASPRPRPVQPSEHMASPRRALLTPLRLLSFPPEPETSNRVLQRYSKKINQFLRVHFCDEDDALWIDWAYRIYDDLVPSSGVLGRVRRALRSGIRIGGKKYVFLAFGESQAKERSCWFFSEDEDLTADQIRSWMGDFTSEKVVAKYAARMGLCFSSTRLAMKVDIKRIKDVIVIKDVTKPPGGKNQYLFTDGVGIAHPSVLDKAAKTLGNTQGADAFPSAVQFRAGGVKGVLVAWPNLPPHLCAQKKNQIMVRPSMVKFLSPEKDLQVMKVSQFTFAYLNRQFITLLSYLGVDDSVFTSLFGQAVRFAQSIGSPGHVAWVFQQNISPEDASDKRVYSMSTFPIQELLEAGFGEEPLVRNVLNAVECRVLQDLKHRARIEIKEGAFLFGVVDELGVLEEGEIFVQWEDARRPDLGRHIVDSKVVVARSPSLHPGDMRVARAVDRVELHHLVNVVVFSQKGVQDLPSQLSGGDLDGDMFTVIWDQRLIPRKMAKAFDPNPPEPRTVDTEITPRDLQDYLIEFMKADNLGQIANAHLAQADRYGPSHPNCLRLCQLHSDAVDYPKSGVPAVQPMNLRATEWPDYMGKTHLQADKIYESDKTLGILFRSIQEPVLDHVQDADFGDARFRASQFEVDESYVKEAAKMARAYNTLLAGQMRRWALSEVEVVSGIVLKSARKRQQKDDSIKEASRDAFSELTRQIFLTCLTFTRSHPPTCSNPLELDALQLFAIAAYQITSDRHLLAAYEEVDRRERERREEKEGKRDSVREEDEEEIEEDPEVEWRARSTKLVSFPWIFHQQLTTVAKILRDKALQRESEGWEVGTSTTVEDDGEDEGWDV